MAALGVALLGGAIGFFAGPMIGLSAITGAALGFTIGSIVAAILFPPDPVHGPRIDDLKVMISEYGAPIPRGWGIVKFAGQIFWATDLIEKRWKEEQGGFFGFFTTKVYHYEYYANYSVFLCEGPATPRRIWFNGELVWKLGGDSKHPGVISYQIGTESDDPPTMHEQFDGVGNVPGYRGVCKVHFQDLHLKDYGNRVPDTEVEVFAGVDDNLSIYYAVDKSGSMAEGSRMFILKEAVNLSLDSLKERIVGNAELRVDIGIVGWSDTSITFERTNVSESDIDDAKAFVNSLSPDGNTSFELAMDAANTWFTTSLSYPEIDRRIMFFVTDGAPNGNTSLAQEHAEDMLDKESGSFNLADETSVDIYGINIIIEDTQFTALFDNTPQDGVPVVNADNSDQLTKILSDVIGVGGIFSVRRIVKDIGELCLFVEGDDQDTLGIPGAVDGYRIARVLDGRKAVEPLQTMFHFDGIEVDGFIKWKSRNGPVVLTVNEDDLGTVPYGADPVDPFIEVRQQEIEIPYRITVTFIDQEREHQSNTVAAMRSRASQHSDQIVDIEFPVVMHPDRAKQVAIRNLYLGVQFRSRYEIQVPRSYGILDPGDLIEIPYEDSIYSMYITELNTNGTVLQAKGLSFDSALYIETEDEGFSNPLPEQVIRVPVLPTIVPFNVPLVNDLQDQVSHFMIAAESSDPTKDFSPSLIYESVDNVVFEPIDKISVEGIIGTAESLLPFHVHTLIDRDNVLRVKIDKGVLTSIPFSDFISSRDNAVMIGNELIFFQKATLVEPGFYDLSVLRRGCYGTEWASDDHFVGETVVFLAEGGIVVSTYDPSFNETLRYYKGVPEGMTHEDATSVSHTRILRHWIPLAPAHLRGNRTGNDLTITFIRRARMQKEWSDFIDAPLDEPDEIYNLRIMNGAAVVRETTLTDVTQFVYTEAMQIEDWGSAQNPVDVEVAQVSSRVGEGYITRRTL